MALSSIVPLWRLPLWTSGGRESNQQKQYEAEPSEICGMNNRLDVTYFFVPTDRGYSLLTRHILNARPHLGVACHASGDNLITDRLYANHKDGFASGMNFS